MEDQDNHHRQEERSDEVGEMYGHITAWTNELGICNRILRKKLQGAEGIILGRDVKGRVTEFFPETIVRARCADLLEGEQADENGFFTKDGEHFGHATAWMRELGIGYRVWRDRMRGAQGISGRDVGGAPMNSGFYSETIVRERFADLLQIEVALETGFIVRHGTRYGHLTAWAEEFGITWNSLKQRLESSQNISIRNPQGKVVNFYSEVLVREKFADLLSEETLVAEGDGFCMRSGECYGHLTAWANTLCVGRKALEIRLKNVQGVLGKDSQHKAVFLYPESLVKKCCADLIQQEMLVADESGFCMNGGDKYGTKHAWQGILGIDELTIGSRLKDVQGVTGKVHTGNVIRNGFYLESIVIERCADLLKEMPVAGDGGLFTHEGMRYGTASAWARDLRIADPAKIRRRLRNNNGVKGKDKGGRVLTFLSEAEVREACADLIQQKQ
ncbi:hypothetical protein KKC44_02455 [Patescibacteria group bacterium]|nr:hypothetical protein [Patescibacteria group bacterium]